MKEYKLIKSFKEYDIHKCKEKIRGIDEKIKVLQKLRKKTVKTLREFEKKLK